MCAMCACTLVCFQMWADILEKAKHGGIKVVQTYIFWNIHEPEKGKVIEFQNQNYLMHACKV